MQPGLVGVWGVFFNPLTMPKPFSSTPGVCSVTLYCRAELWAINTLARAHTHTQRHTQETSYFLKIKSCIYTAKINCTHTDLLFE